MKTEDLITDIDKKIKHFLRDALQASLNEDFASVKSCVHAAKKLIEARCTLTDINGVRFGVTKPKLGRKPILVYEGRECFASKCRHRGAGTSNVYKCLAINGPLVCTPTPEHCPRMKP